MNVPADHPDPKEPVLVSDEQRTRELHDALSYALEAHLKNAEADGADALMGVLNFTRTSLVWLSIHADLRGSQRRTFFGIALQYLAQSLEKDHRRLTDGETGPNN